MLTDDQNLFVCSGGSRVVALAGAGSGKTECLVRRIIILVERGTPAHRIVCFTFGVKAAEEISCRISDALEGRLGFCGTIHSFALSILNRFAGHLAYKPGISVYDSDQTEIMALTIARELHYRNGSKWKNGLSTKKIRAYFQACVRGDLIEKMEQKTRRACSRIYSTYKRRLRTCNALDYDGLIYHVRRLLEEHDDVREWVTMMIQHVVVDEIQDLDEAQFAMLDVLCGRANITAAGDLRQCLYRFRGARPDLAQKLADTCSRYDIPDNFRSGTAIVEAANALIANNPEGDVPMVARMPHKGSIDVIEARSHEIDSVVKVLMAEAYGPGDIAILGRTNDTLRRARKSLAGFEIETNDREVPGWQELQATLRLIDNPADEAAFLQLQKTFDIGGREYAKLRKVASEKGCSTWQAYDGDHELAALIRANTPESDVDSVSETAGKWDGLKHAVAYWRERWAGLTVRKALQMVCGWRPDEDIARTGITLATIHAVKGMAFPAVIILGCQEGGFPHSWAIRDGCLDEERRLAYVAITRSQERCVMVCAPRDDAGDRGASRFIAEAGLMVPV